MKHLTNIIKLILFVLSIQCYATTDDQIPFDDTLLEEALVYPDWFELNSGNLTDHLAEANAEGKSGFIVYFGQKRCAYCEKFIKTNLASPETAQYIKKHYDIIPIDIWGIEETIDTDGKKYTERELSHYTTKQTSRLHWYFITTRENPYSDYAATTHPINSALH